MEGGSPGVQESASATDKLVEEQAALEIAARIDLLRLATREEITETMEWVREGTTGDFFLKLFAETREMNETAVQAAVDKRNAETEAKWETSLQGLRGNLNHTATTKTASTGLILKVGRKNRIWRWESEKVQETENLPEAKREERITQSETRHSKILKIASATKDKNIGCLLQILTNQTAGVKMTEIEAIFEGTDVNIDKLINGINSETLTEHNAKIHVRNGIAIIGPIDPHWNSKFKEPIVVDRAKAIAQLIERTREGTIEKIKAKLQGTGPLKEKIADLEARIEALQTALEKANHDVEEALHMAEEAQLQAQTAVAQAAKKAETAVREAAQKVDALQKELDDAKQSLRLEKDITAKATQRAERAERQAAGAEETRAEAVRRLGRISGMQENDIQRIAEPLRERLRALERTERMALERARSAETKLSAIKTTSSVTPEELATLKQSAAKSQQAERDLSVLREEFTRQKTALTASLTTARGEAAALRTQLEALQSKTSEADTLKEQVAALQGQIREQQEMLESLTAPIAQAPTAPPAQTQPSTTTSAATAQARQAQPAHPATPPQQDSGYLSAIRTGQFEFPEDLRKAVARAIMLGSVASGSKGELPRTAWRKIKHELSGRKGLQPHIHEERLSLHGKLQELGENEGPVSSAKVQAFLKELQPDKQ